MSGITVRAMGGTPRGSEQHSRGTPHAEGRRVLRREKPPMRGTNTDPSSRGYDPHARALDQGTAFLLARRDVLALIEAGAVDASALEARLDPADSRSSTTPRANAWYPLAAYDRSCPCSSTSRAAATRSTSSTARTRAWRS